MPMKRILLACLVFASCSKAPPPPPPAPTRAVTEAPPPPAIQLPQAKDEQDEFKVAAGRPTGKLVGDAHPTITFSEPVVALSTLEQQDPSTQLRLEPKVKGRWHWLGSASVEFVNDEPWPMSTAFHLIVPQGFKALDGTPLQTPWQLDFTTPAVQVQPYATNPAESACRWSAPSQHFEIIVNQPVKEPEKAFFFEAGEQKKQVAARLVKATPFEHDRRVKYEIAPAQDLPADAPFAVGLDGSARGVEGDLPAGVEWRQNCRTMGAMKVERVFRCSDDPGHCAHGPVVIAFTNPLGDEKELKSHVHFTPEVAIDWDDTQLPMFATRAALFGKFRPGTSYQVKIDAGIKDAMGQQAPAAEGTVAMDDLLPSLYVADSRALLESGGDGQLPAQVTNLGSLEADLWALGPAEVAQLQARDAAHQFPSRPPDAPLRLALAYPKNEPHLAGVDLRTALHGAKSGFVLARLRAPGTDFADHPLRVMAQITDLAVHAKIGATSSLVWVTSVSTAKGVPQAKVAVLSAAGAQLATAVTDAQGIALLPGYGKLLPKAPGYEGPRVLVTAQLGDDAGYSATSAWDDAIPVEVNRNFDVLGKQGLGLVFADRGIYRPGDTVHVKGILREQQAGEMHTPSVSQVPVRVSDPDGNAILTQPATLTRYGTFTLEVPIPKETRLGQFSIEAGRFGYGSFAVAEYRAPQFRVDVQIAKSELTAGEALEANVVARYLFGGAMDRAPASWSVQRATEDFAPPRNDGFRFGRNTWNWDDNQPQPQSGQFAAGKGEIGRDGALAVKAGQVDAPGDRTARFTFEAEVQDVSRQTVAGRASVLVHPAAYYVGLGASATFAKAGETLSLPVIAAAPSGERVTGAAVHVVALLRSWHSVRKRGVNGLFETLSEPVEEKAAECEVATPADCKLALQKPGFYDLRAESKDDKGRLALTTESLYAVGAGFAAWQGNDTAKLEIVPDKTAYQPGETAHLLVKSPYPSCRALVTIEREGVSDSRVLELTGTAATIDVPVTEAMVPNAYVGVLLVRERLGTGRVLAPLATEGRQSVESGDDPGRPSLRLGYAPLKVGAGVKRLAVSVTPARAEYKPREKVAVDISVRDARGAPAAAEVQLYAVDDAVLRLTGYQLPDPLAAMFPEHPLSVALGEELPRIVRRVQFGEKGEVQPGGGGGLGPSGDVRSRFVTTVFWQALETGSEGKAHAEFDLPDNLTTFRIFAVAASDGDKFGGGQAEIRVALPLLVLPALPRFARVGDEFEAGVAVHSTRAIEGLHVSAQAAGGVRLAEAEKTVAIEAGVAKEVRFKFKATAAGPATLRFRAAAGDLGDAVEQVIPISLPVEMEAVAVAGNTNASKAEGLLPPKDVQSASLEVTLASTALGGLSEAFNQLVEYPYGCVEQLSSRLVPFVAVREVERTFGAPPFGLRPSPAEPAPPGLPPHQDAVVTETVAKIEKLQAPSGGFLYWPTSDCPYAWSSIYATLALQRAQEMDYPVHRDVLLRAKKFLARVAAGEASCRGERIAPEERIFALQVLARMGDPRPGYYDELFAARAALPLFAKAQLADAIGLGKGKRANAEQLLKEIFDAAKETPRDLHFEESDANTYAPLLSSDTRTTGMVLQTLVDLKPAHPYVSKIARYLTDVRKGGAYRNTQEAAYSLMGLAELVRVKEREAPDFAARVVLGGNELASAEFRKRTLQTVTKKLPLPAGDKQLPFEFKLDGKGTLYYTALLRYAPAQLPRDARNEGVFVQRWLEPYDQPGKAAAQFAAGDLLRVRVRVATPQERNFIAVDVPLPAGLEAVDTALQTSSMNVQETEETEGAAESYGFWSPFVYSEKRDDRVVYFSDHLPPGVHAVSFVARATTPGRFLMKSAHAGEMYAPEVFGRSDAFEVTVTAQQPLASR